jgi:hypothetical protein
LDIRLTNQTFGSIVARAVRQDTGRKTMANDKPRSAQSAQQETKPRLYSPELQPLLQSLLATLADIDFEHERERDTISTRTMDMNLKIRLLEKLKQHHSERREPYIQQLAILQKRIRQTCQ